MSDARRKFTGKLLVDLLDVVAVDHREYATVAIHAIAQQVNELEVEARAEGFAEGVHAAQAAMQPDAELERLKRAGEEAVDGMLAAFSQMKLVTNH